MRQVDQERKKAWKAQERQQAQAAFPLPNELLELLFAFVETQVRQAGCDHTHRFSETWVAENNQSRMPMIEWFEENGGFCDCEVGANTRDHWERNK